MIAHVIHVKRNPLTNFIRLYGETLEVDRFEGNIVYFKSVKPEHNGLGRWRFTYEE